MHRRPSSPSQHSSHPQSQPPPPPPPPQQPQQQRPPSPDHFSPEPSSGLRASPLPPPPIPEIKTQGGVARGSNSDNGNDEDDEENGEIELREYPSRRLIHTDENTGIASLPQAPQAPLGPDTVRVDDDTDEEEERTMSTWDKPPRPGLVSRPSDGRAAQPLLDDGEGGSGDLGDRWGAGGERGRGITSYEGPREVTERERRRHQLRSRSPTTMAAK